jgi:serine/threonine protein kinase
VREEVTVSETDPRVGTTFGKYKITGVVGKGGMGEVYEAYDNQINRTVALKIIKSQYANDRTYRLRFERESHAAAKLQEPHVIPIHGYGEIDGSLFIDMRLVRGTDLQAMLGEHPLDPERAVAIVSQVGAALDAAHAEGLIHRDVKPQNILVTPADFAYLVDFGIAEAMGDTGDTRLTQVGAAIGSWAYMAPERFAHSEITPAVDIYSLACVLYECLTGAMPFANASQQAVIAAHITMPPPRPSVTNPRVSSAFDEVIARGMAKEPDDRYGSAGALGRAATRALKNMGTAPINTPETAPTQRASWQPPRPKEAVPQYFPPPAPDFTRPARDFPRPAPAPVPQGERSGGSRLVPTVIAIAAVLVLGAVGIIIGLLWKMNSTPAPTAEPTTTATYPSVTSTATQSRQTSTESLPSGNIPPPLVTGPDLGPQHATCDGGYQLPTATGFGTRAGRGTPQTSCIFANSVLNAYWHAYGNASLAMRPVSAQGAVSCTTIGVGCDPSNPGNFLMQCAGDGANPWIKCTGGNNAVVYLW